MGGAERLGLRRRRSLRQALPHRRYALGIMHVVLLLLSFWTSFGTCPGLVPECPLIAFYTGAVVAGHRGRLCLPFAAIAFVWFIVALRMWVGSMGGEQALFLMSSWSRGIIFILLLLEAAAAFWF